MTRIPEVAIGWRAWRMRGTELRSWAADEAWRPGDNVARCLRGAAHSEGVPGNGRHRGLWALDSPRRRLRLVATDGDPDEPPSGDAVIGLIASLGRGRPRPEGGVPRRAGQGAAAPPTWSGSPGRRRPDPGTCFATAPWPGAVSVTGSPWPTCGRR